jgi:hypothetical protein
VIWAPISINLSVKNRRLSNIFWWMSTLPLACVAATMTMLMRSGVKPGQGASLMFISCCRQ